MKKIIAKSIPIAIVFLAVVAVSCTRENPVEPVAEFTTSLDNNTAYAGEPFYIYLDKTQGDFLTLFSGLNESKTYDPDNPAATGDPVNTELDSMEVTYYNAAGNYRLTMVASSSGNWAEDYVQDTFGVTLNVIDARTGFKLFKIDGVSGQYTEDGTEIHFFTHNNEDLTAKEPEFITNSSEAVVTIDGEVQESRKNVVDFSPLNPGDMEGRPVIYRVEAPNGDFTEYTVKYILREASSEKQLFSLTAFDWGNLTFELTAEDEANQEVKLIHPPGVDISDTEFGATANEGAKVYIGDVEIAEEEEDVDLVANSVVTVEAEDGSTKDYTILLYEEEALETFSFVEAGGVAMNPVVEGTVEDNTISLKVLAGTDLTSVVAEFTGLTETSAFVNDTELTSGVTAADYSGSPVLELRADDGTVITEYTVDITEIAK